MTAMLARIRNPAEATEAIAAGVDRLVVRTASLVVLANIGAVRGSCPVSLWADADDRLEGAAAACGADEIWTPDAVTAPRLRRWAVVRPGDEASVAAEAARGAAGIVVADDERAGRLLATIGIADLDRQRRRAAALGLGFGIAAGMEAPDVPRLLALAPDLLVFDSLLRRDAAPSGPVEPGRIRVARGLMAAMPAAPTAPLPAETDRIFVRDWVLPLKLGAYDHETEPQRVRFTVEAEVMGPSARSGDMRDVVTYDLITDAIARATVAHVALVETIAEDVAALVLAHPRVAGVDVTVEKLDLGPGSLGCRIKRRRAS